LVNHSEAAVGGAGSDRLGSNRAMDAQMRVLLAVIEVDGARAERVLAAAVHAVLVLAVMLRLALLHVERRDPARPFLLIADSHGALELQAFATDRDGIAPRRRKAFDEVKATST